MLQWRTAGWYKRDDFISKGTWNQTYLLRQRCTTILIRLQLLQEIVLITFCLFQLLVRKQKCQ